MSDTPDAGELREPDDLTARARIRDAALAELGERGFRGATFRSIAQRAGVSVGLVQHHFGTKDQLRQACDEAVMGLVRRKVEASGDGTIGDRQVVDGLLSSAPLLQRYVSRALADRSPAVGPLLEFVMDESEGYLCRAWPGRFEAGTTTTRNAAAVMTAMNLSVMLLQEQLAERVEVEPYTHASIVTTGRAMLDVYEAFGELSLTAEWKEMRAALEAAAAAVAASGDGPPGTEPRRGEEEP